MSDGYDSNDDGGQMGGSVRRSGRKLTKKEVFELKDEPTIKRTKKFKTNPDGSPIVPGYPQTYHSVIAQAVSSGNVQQSLSLAATAAGASTAADGTATASGSAAAAPGSLAANSKNKRSASKLYCFCQKPYDDATPMIQCDECKEWYHFSCLNVTDEQSIQQLENQASYKCPPCVNGVNKKRKSSSTAGKKRKSKRDEDDAASEEEADVPRNAVGQPIDPNDPTWVNPYAELLADKVRSQQYTPAQLEQMRQYMHYGRAQYAMLQQQIAQQQAAAQQAQLAAMQQQQLAAQQAAAAASGGASTTAGADATAAAAPAKAE